MHIVQDTINTEGKTIMIALRLQAQTGGLLMMVLVMVKAGFNGAGQISTSMTEEIVFSKTRNGVSDFFKAKSTLSLL